ncbi:MAG: DUF998 domain-containing protein [Hyphomicrobiaceae bacterium]|nr:DUF998 domain-containing protein [Hyphomicrobiaceae bacterium]MCC0023746.1 DUF998 domain-containing protein [Hyphomicrobiaceae bacterium]
MNNVPSFSLALAGIVIMLLAMLVGPFFSAPEFMWITHTTSEQAAQGLAGAWIMRTGFVAFGAGTLLAAFLDRHRRVYVRWALMLFGFGLIAAAIWSNAPITANVPADMGEDWLHSAASWVVGMAFILACLARLFAPGGSKSDSVAWIGLLVAILIPLLMNLFPDQRGLFQRLMFLTSFVFVVREFAPPLKT